MSSCKAVVRAVASHLPVARLTNEDLAREFRDWDVDKIYSKTGIASRAIAAPGECASDLGIRAAEKLFASAPVQPGEIDFLLFCTQSPDYFLPASACVMQHRLGLPTSSGALDFNQGCSGYVYGLSVAKGLIESGTASNVLLITAETYSRYLRPDDRSVRTIFGDGAAATWVGTFESEREMIGPFVLGTDGNGAKHLIVRNGAARNEASAESAAPGCPPQLYMNGAEIFSFTLKTVPAAVTRLLQLATAGLDDIDYFVFHQANRFMLEQLRKKINIPTGKFCVDLENTGNTVSSTIPIALESALARGDIRPGSRVMLVGFGVGLSWAATLIEIPHT